MSIHTFNVCHVGLGDVLLKPIVVNAGKDVSHWFNKDTKDVRELLCFVLGSVQRVLYRLLISLIRLQLREYNIFIVFVKKSAYPRFS